MAQSQKALLAVYDVEKVRDLVIITVYVLGVER